MKLLRTLVLLAGATLALSACGGDDDSSSGSGGSSGGSSDSDGKTLFVATCGGCHALDDAETKGSMGPDLSGRALNAKIVANQIENGGGGMPGGLLEGKQKDAVAEYVAEASGS